MDDLIQVALLAYRHGRYLDAIELLLQVVDAEPGNWLAKLYLATAYGKHGQTADSQRLFKRMTIDCPDHALRTKAQDGLRIVEEQLTRHFRRETPDKLKLAEAIPARAANWW